MSQYSEKIIELLCVDHPDLSDWTIICASERAVDPVQYLIHSELGGILPKVEGLNSYITKKIGENSNLNPIPGDERLLYFIRFVAERFPDEAYPARRAAVLLPLIAKLAEYKIGRDTISGAERFTEDEWNSLEEYLETAKDLYEKGRSIAFKTGSFGTCQKPYLSFFTGLLLVKPDQIRFLPNTSM